MNTPSELTVEKCNAALEAATLSLVTELKIPYHRNTVKRLIAEAFTPILIELGAVSGSVDDSTTE